MSEPACVSDTLGGKEPPRSLMKDSCKPDMGTYPSSSLEMLFPVKDGVAFRICSCRPRSQSKRREPKKCKGSAVSDPRPSPVEGEVLTIFSLSRIVLPRCRLSPDAIHITHKPGSNRKVRKLGCTGIAFGALLSNFFLLF